jgi:hypothetical protein
MQAEELALACLMINNLMLKRLKSYFCSRLKSRLKPACSLQAGKQSNLRFDVMLAYSGVANLLMNRARRTLFVEFETRESPYEKPDASLQTNLETRVIDARFNRALPARRFACARSRADGLEA